MADPSGEYSQIEVLSDGESEMLARGAIGGNVQSTVVASAKVEFVSFEF
ncbi:MAG: hypothetical protein HC865_09145 [Cyanobacteria bacterium RU_5_0]|nr:hypothetical protein [Cyanobacteria bacterium RU_5_0]